MFWLGLFLLAFLVLNGCLHLGVRGGEGELRPDRAFGGLTLFLALLGLVGHLLSASERFLFAPEIGVMMYEGSDLQRAGLYVLLAGIVVFGALVPETVRQFVQRGAPLRGSRLVVLVFVALPVSAVTFLRIRVLNDADLSALHVQAYDLFFPPLVIWTGTCILLALAWCLDVPERFWPVVPVVWTVSFWLCGEFRDRPYDDPWTLWAWRSASFLVVCAFGLFLAKRKLAARAGAGAGEGRREESGDPPAEDQESDGPPEPVPAEGAAGGVFLWEKGSEKPPGPGPVSESPRSQVFEAQKERRRFWTAIALGVLMVSFFVIYLLTSSALLQVKLRTLVLGYVLFWLVLAEFEDQRVSLTYRLLSFGKSSWRKRSAPPEGKPPGEGQDAARQAGDKGLVGTLKGMLSPGKTVAALLGALVVAFALLVVNELPNRHKTVVMPFRDLAGHGAQELDEGIAEYVTYQLALYDQGLRQVSIPLSGPAPRRGSSGFTLGSATDPGTSFTTSNNLKVGDFEVPLQVILNPILEPLRRTLDTRVIRGSVHVDEEHYSLIATSSRGESWRVESERDPDEDSVRDPGTNKLKFRSEKLYGKLRELAEQLAFEIYANGASASGPASGMTSSWEAFHSFWTGFTILRNLEENPPLPKRANAARAAKLRRQASQAIEKAIVVDRSFALASYHLALARLSEVKTVDESKESIRLLRETVEDVPEFIPAYNALAYTLVRWSGDKEEAESLLKRVLLSWAGGPISRALAYHGLALLELDPDSLLAVAEGFQEADRADDPNEPDELGNNTRAFYYARKAESLYAEAKANDPQILRRRAAVLGDLGRLLERRSGELVAVPGDHWSCRGETLLFSLRALDQAQAAPLQKGWELEMASGASIPVDRGELEEAFAEHGLPHLELLTEPKRTDRPGEAWQLETSQGKFFLLVEGHQLNVYGRVLRRSPYSHAARRFLHRTVALEPHDRVNLCQLAASNHLLGRTTAMDHLENDTKMRLVLAHRYAVHYPGSSQKIDREAVPAFFFERALEEYKALLARNPQNDDVRDGACNVLSVAILRSSLGDGASRWEQTFSCPLEEMKSAPVESGLYFKEPATLKESVWWDLVEQTVLLVRQKDPTSAETLLPELRRLAKDHKLLQAATHTLAGRIHELKKDGEQAAKDYEQALSQFQKLGDGKGQVSTPEDLIRVYATLSREMMAMYEVQGKDSVEDHARKAVEVGERLGSSEVLAYYLDEYAQILENAERLEEAEANYRRAFEIRSYSLEPGDVRIASSFQHLGRIACLRGDHGTAASYRQRAYAMLRRFGTARTLDLAQAAEALGRSSLWQGRWEDAEGPLVEALEVVEEEGLEKAQFRLEHVLLVAARAALLKAREAAPDPGSRRFYRDDAAGTLQAAEESLAKLVPDVRPPFRADAVLKDLRRATRCGLRPEDVQTIFPHYVAERRRRLRVLGHELEDGDPAALAAALRSFRKEATLPEETDPDAVLLDPWADTVLAELARLEELRRSGGDDFLLVALAPAPGREEVWIRFFEKKVVEVDRDRPLQGIDPKGTRVYVDLWEGGVEDVRGSPPEALWLVGGPESLREVFFSPHGVLECWAEDAALRCQLEEEVRAYVPDPPSDSSDRLRETLERLEEGDVSLARALALSGLGHNGWLAPGDARDTKPPALEDQTWLISWSQDRSQADTPPIE